MAEEELFGDLQDIINASFEGNNGANNMPQVFPQSTSLPVLPSHMPLPPQPSPQTANPRPRIRIVEEPTNNIIRFRYKCEGRTAGSIAGMNSSPESGKTFPTIEIVDYKGPVVVVVSCVTKDEPYRQHPHWLVSKDEAENCKSGVYSKRLPPEERRLVLQKVGIQCVKKTEVRNSLLEREQRNVDPYRAKFDHKDNIGSINLYELRLCYQAFITVGNSKVPLDPVVSSPIYGKSNELTITRLCSCAAKVSGGDEIIMLCEKIAKDDIQIRFFETNDDGVEVWEAYAEFQQTDIFKQMAIAFKTPRYRNPEITHCVNVEVQLVRPSDRATSAALHFEYYPNPGMLTFARLQRKLKRKQDMDVFQQILSLDSETTATKYSCPPVDLNEDENNTVSSDEQQSSGTLNEFEIAVKKLQFQHRGESNEGDATVTEYTDGLDNDNEPEPDMEIELEVPQLLPQLVEDCTQTSTPMEEILQHPQLQPRALSNVDKINEWMKSSEFERTDSLTVENGDTQSLSNSTAQTAFTNVSSMTANTTITNQLDEEEEEEKGNKASRRDTLENPAVKDLPETELVSASAQASVDIDENFDETATYTSLKMAYNNPVEIPKEDGHQYHVTNPFSQMDEAELVVLTNPPAPRIKVNAAQTPATPPSPPLPLPPRTPSPSPDPENRLPPLPPKPKRNSQDLSVSELSASNSISISRSRNGSVSSNRTTPSPIVIMRTPDQSPTKRLPASTPSASPKKRQGFFSRFFSRRKSKTDDEESQAGNSPNKLAAGSSNATTPTGSREPSVTHFSLADPNRSSSRSMQVPNNTNRSGRPVGRSSSSVSGKRPAHLDADVIHIPLKGGDSENSLLRPETYSTTSTLSYGRPLDRKTLSTLQLADIPISDGNMELVAIADRQSIKNLCEGAYGVVLDPSVDLSEAEHFALYTSKSPEPPFGNGEDQQAGESLSQQRRLEARKAVESVKRKLMSSDIFPQNPKQYKSFTNHPQPQPQNLQPQQQQQQQQPMGGMYLAHSPSYVPTVKIENSTLDMDSRSCPSVESTYPNYNYPSPRSTCSTVDSINGNIMKPSELAPPQENLNFTVNMNSNGDSSWSPTSFNGGTITPTNIIQYNNSPSPNHNNNNNSIFSVNMNDISPPNATQTNFMPYQTIAKQPFDLTHHQQQQQQQPQQQHHQQQQHQQQQQQQQHQNEEPRQSFSDLILSSTLMDFPTTSSGILEHIDTNDLIQDMEQTLNLGNLGMTAPSQVNKY